ncbi:MscL family protein [Nocardioides okcheonensis]|uniref:MscL family protein n=1 Tax=Nocardioides okcheonensis TaxID=2894081 RepID=UPI001E2D6EF9|nr:MscL family protein [Nocardioides okcheonensis]UFN46515.1 MscL family protein [Nocardioides okcheonensis]
MTGFKNFILRGNLVELAVAVIIGTSFAAVVTAFTGMLLSAVSKVTDGKDPDFDNFAPGDVLVGPFLTALIAFLILAAVVYFFVVVPYTKAKDRFFPAEPAGTPADVALLEEIRDLLKAQNGTTPTA